MLLADLHLLELAQAAQAHVQDRLGLHVGQGEPLDQARLGLFFLADDTDDLVEVEIDQQIAVEDFQPALDRRETVVGAADQDLVAVIQPTAQHLLQRHHPGGAGRVKDIHVEREPRFQGCRSEDRFHQHFGFGAAGLGFQHKTDRVAALVADVAQQGEVSCPP